MHLQIAPDVLERNELRQRIGHRRLDFTTILAERGWDPAHAEHLVDAFLRIARETLAVLLAHRRRIYVFGEPEDTPLVHAESLANRQRAHGDIVLFRAGEILQRRPERTTRNHAQVDLQARVQNDAALRRARAQDACGAVETDEVIHHRCAIAFMTREDVYVPDRLLPSAQAAGELDLVHTRCVRHVLEHTRDQLLDLVDLEAATVLAVILDRALDLLGALPSESVELPNGPRVELLSEVVHRLHAELLEELLGLLRTDAVQSNELDQRHRDFGRHLLQPGDTTGLQKLDDVVGHRLADARQLREVLAGFHHRRERTTEAVHRVHRVAIGANPERVGALDLQQIGQSGQHA